MGEGKGECECPSLGLTERFIVETKTVKRQTPSYSVRQVKVVVVEEDGRRQTVGLDFQKTGPVVSG